MGQADSFASEVTAGRRRSSWLQILVGIGLLVVAGFLVWDARSLMPQIGDVRPAIGLALVALQVLYLIVQSERLRHCVRVHAGRRIPFGRWLRFHTSGRLLNSVVNQSGHVYQAVVLKRSDGLPYSDLATVYLVQAWFATAVSFAIASAFVGSLGTGFRFGLVVALAAALAAPVVGGLLGRSRWASLVTTGRVGAAMQRIIVGLGDGARSYRLIAVLALWTVVGFTVGLGVLWFAYSAADVALPLSAIVLALAFMQVSNVIMITPGNLGVQELGLAAITELIGVGAGVGVVVSALVRLSGLLALLLISAALAVTTRLSARARPRSARSATDRGPWLIETRADED